jgi:ferredoxin
MQIYRLKINKNICIGCNDCVVSCPLNFQQLKEKGYLTEENAVVLVKNGMAYDIYVEGRDVNCDGCGVCLKYCPVSAIELHLVEKK